MALTAEDVLKKTFTQTQFRRGYDEREVDDFLDEVVVEMRRASKELDDCRAGREGTTGDAALGTGDGPTAAAPAGETAGDGADFDERVATLAARAEEAEGAAQRRIEEATARAEEAEQAAEQRIAEAEQAAAAAEGPSGEGRVDGPEGTQGPDTATLATAAGGSDGAASLIALAQRLHDEHVAAGRSEHDRMVAEAESTRDAMLTEAQSRHDELISTAEARHEELVTSAQATHDELVLEGTTTRDAMLTEARERATGMVAEARQTRQQVLEQLDHDRLDLEQQVEQLRGFEREYRTRLRAYIEEQLGALDATAGTAPDSGDGHGDGHGEGEDDADLTAEQRTT